jgi:peptidoglycan/LPS O-acetylase OafA/YrhL
MPWVIPGGFVGVDVFFVISGFLITRIVWRDLEAGVFSLPAFYERRIRRLLPALVVVILACAGLEMAIGLPQEVESFAWSAISSAFYFSNHYFLAQDNYFDESLSQNPLLHTWSLSVEEQFYIAYPALLILVFRYRRHAPALLACVAALSLMVSEALVESHPSAAFFIMPTRLWELVLGGTIARLPFFAPKRLVGEGIAVSGLALILGSAYFFSEETPFPGLLALMPVGGTALVLWVGQAQGLWTSRLLALGPARLIGKISYSVYLWHWPIVVFYKLQYSPEPNASERLGLTAASLLIGYLSWQFVEQPMRVAAGKGRVRLAFVGAAAATAVVALIGFLLAWNDGWKSRYSNDQLRYIALLDYDADRLFRTNTCFLTSESDDLSYFDEAACLNYDASRRNVMILGDSHAAQYVAAFSERWPDIRFAQVTASGCRPLVSYTGEPRCTDLVQKAIETYLTRYRYDTVILAGRWEPTDLPALPETVRLLASRTREVVVLGPIIEYKQALPRLLARYRRGQAEVEEAQFFREVTETDRLMREALHETPGSYYSILHALCAGRNCRTISSNGQPIQFDSSHLTHQGAVEVVGILRDQGLLRCEACG